MPRISNLPALTTPDNSDELAIVDTSASVTKKITRGDLLKAPLPTNSVTTAAITNGAVTSAKIDFTTTGKIWWEEIGRTTLGVNGDSVTVSGLPARKYIKVIFDLIPSGVITPNFRLNNDSGNNYAFRYNAAFATGSTVNTNSVGTWGGTAARIRGEIDFTNLATAVKTGKAWGVDGDTAAGSAPGFVEFWWKWVNTSAAVNRIDFNNIGSGDFAAGSEVVILAHD